MLCKKVGDAPPVFLYIPDGGNDEIRISFCFENRDIRRMIGNDKVEADIVLSFARHLGHIHNQRSYAANGPWHAVN